MNIELLKQLADLRNQFNKLTNEFKTGGAYGVRIDGEVQVSVTNLIGVENLQIVARNSNEYPYEVFTFFEEIKIFAIATSEQVAKFSQLKDKRKEILLQQLAALEKEEEVTA